MEEEEEEQEDRQSAPVRCVLPDTQPVRAAATQIKMRVRI